MVEMSRASGKLQKPLAIHEILTLAVYLCRNTEYADTGDTAARAGEAACQSAP
jgi:hypothetical protein